VPDDGRVVDRELIEEPNDPLGMAANGHVPTGWAITSPVAEKVDHYDAMPLWNERNYVRPKVRRRWEPMEENDRLAGSATPGGVVVESCSVYVDELTPHAGTLRRAPEDIDGMSALP
jgi:hypothetical protein